MKRWRGSAVWLLGCGVAAAAGEWKQIDTLVADVATALASDDDVVERLLHDLADAVAPPSLADPASMMAAREAEALHRLALERRLRDGRHLEASESYERLARLEDLRTGESFTYQPASRTLSRQAPVQRIPGVTVPRPPKTLTPTGRTETIAGIPCEELRVERDDLPPLHIWVARRLPAGAEEVPEPIAAVVPGRSGSTASSASCFAA